jgi:hypothetical protein
MARKAKERPQETAYFAKFPLDDSEQDEAALQFKLLADLGLADSRPGAIRRASEAMFAEALQGDRPIDWRNFADAVLKRSAAM